MKLSKFLILVFCWFPQLIFGQTPKKGDFTFPIRPNQQNFLAGTMGELRPTHFHAGIDIKTGNITGLPVFSVAEGYILRAKVAMGGYGNSLYIKHPHNGTISVYAHLESFSPEVAAYVRDAQYREESFEVDLMPEPNKFIVKQGDIVAKSGNTGSSSGPHLHFEIRKIDNVVLDPLKYGFDEIKDNIPPILAKIAFVTLDKNARVNGQYGRHEFNVVFDGRGIPVIDQPVSIYGRIGVEVYAYDMCNGTPNKNGVLQQSLTLDGKPVFHQDITQLKFDMTRNILVHTNYKRAEQGGSRFNKLYLDDGNDLDFYVLDPHDGVLRIFDPFEHVLNIQLVDSYDNISQYQFTINQMVKNGKSAKIASQLNREGFELHGNVLEFAADLAKYDYCEAKVFSSGKEIKEQLAYDINHTGYYLWDMRHGVPDSIKVCDQSYYFNYKAMIPDNVKRTWVGDKVSINFEKYSLFDTIYLDYQYKESNGREIFNFENQHDPFKGNVSVTLSPNGAYDIEKSHVYTIDSRNRLSYIGGYWLGNKIQFKTRNLISFTIATDEVSPTIHLIRSSMKGAVFKIRDNLSGIKSFRALLDGRWLLMNYDPKSNTIWSDEKTPLTGELVLIVTDNAQNEARFERKF